MMNIDEKEKNNIETVVANVDSTIDEKGATPLEMKKITTVYSNDIDGLTKHVTYNISKDSGSLLKITVNIGSEFIDDQVKKKMSEVAKVAKIPGFRSGKAPAQLIESAYKEGVKKNIFDKAVAESYKMVCADAKLKPLDAYKMETISINPLMYTLNIDIYPEITLANFSEITVDKPVITFVETDVDEIIKNLQFLTSEKYYDLTVDGDDDTDHQNEVKMGDSIEVDFGADIFNLDGTVATVRNERDLKFDIGGSDMWPEFCAQFIGKRVGNDLEFEIIFPNTHMDDEIAGRKAHFKSKINKAKRKIPLTIEELLLKAKMNLDMIDVFRKKIADKTKEHINDCSLEKFTTNVLNAVLKSSTFDVPLCMIKKLTAQRAKQLSSQFERVLGKKNVTLPKKAVEIAFYESAVQAKKNIIFSEITKINNIIANKEEIQEKINAKINILGGSGNLMQLLGKQRFDQYIENLKTVIEEDLLDKAVYDFVKKSMKIVEQPCSYKEFFDEFNGNNNTNWFLDFYNELCRAVSSDTV